MFREPATHQAAIATAAGFIAKQFSARPRMAIVLGTGAGQIGDAIEPTIVIPYGEIPGFPQSTALGHKGQLICGQLGDVPVIAMQGRFHLYEGYPLELATLPIHVLAELGAESLFVTNAAGGLNPKFLSGELMLLDSHLDLMWRTHPTLWQFRSSPTHRPIRRTDGYNHELAQLALQTARANDFVLHQGVYAALLGPNYETRAEYRMLRRMGADAAGMSTVPEVAVGNCRGLRTVAFSVITNIAKPDVLESTSGQEVIDAAEVAAPNLLTLIRAMLGER